MPENSPQASRGLYRFAVFTSCCTVLLLAAGALVTNNLAGDSVPDWPLAYGRLIPPLVGGIRFEYSHRVIAGVVSILTLVLAIWVARVDRRPMARWLGWLALGLVIAQAVLGGIRVLEGDPAVSATAHAALAQIFFITLAGLTMYLGPWWQSEMPPASDSGSPRATSVGAWTTGAIFLQVVLGAAFRHGAIGIVPHLIGAGIVTGLVVWTGRTLKRRFPGVHAVRRGVLWLHSFFGLQVLLGFAAWWAMSAALAAVQPTALFVTLTVAHVLGGALLLASSTILTLACFRLVHPLSNAAGSLAEPARHVSPGSAERAGG